MKTSDPARFMIVIPARYGSTRFPGKPLHLIAGKALVQHVWERCQAVRGVEAVVIATDDERIATQARAMGAEVVMTRADHPSGTDRLAEVAASYPEFTHFLNVQGDEPLISPELIAELAQALRDDPSLPMVTAATPITDPAEVENPNIVKVVLTKQQEALYFSRSVIPYARQQRTIPVYRHLGLYGYARDFLKKFVSWSPSPLELAESLEQLRALENGARIKVLFTDESSPGVDTPEQAALIEQLLLRRA